MAVAEPIDPNWWNLFKDPMLTALERRVAGENLDVQVATVRIAESRAQLGVAGAAQFPTLNANGSYTRQKASDVGVFSNSPNALGRQRRLGQQRRRHSRRATQRVRRLSGGVRCLVGGRPVGQGAALGGIRHRLGGGVGRGAARQRCCPAWRNSRATTYSCAACSRCCGIARDNVKIAQQNLQLTQQRAAGGVTTDLDVANAAAQLRTTAAEIPRFVQQESELINAISLLLGQPPNALQAELIQAKPVPPVPPRVPVGLPSELARRRPDIRQAEAQLHATTADIGVAVANFYPSVKLSGSLGLQAIQPWKMFNIDARDYAVGPGITIPIFEGGQLRATLALRQAQQQEAAITYQKTVLGAWHEVDNALTAYQTEQARRDQLIQAVAQNQRALGLAQSRYQEGVADFLQVLTAQQNLLSTQQQLALATTNVSANLVALYKALGGGWETQMPAANDDLSPIGAPHW